MRSAGSAARMTVFPKMAASAGRSFVAMMGAGLVALALPASPVLGGDHATADVAVAEPADYRMTDYRSPVPASLKGARVIDAKEALALHAQGNTLFIDVYPRAPKPAGLPANTIWRSSKHDSIAGAVWLPNVGYGKLAAEPEAYFRSNVERLTGGDKSKPMVFFCLKDCWMSWNAAKRAIAWGFTQVIWFPDGTDGWREIGQTIANVEPEPGGG